MGYTQRGVDGGRGEGEGRSRAGIGTWGEVARAFTVFCRVPGLQSVKPHSVALSDRGVCPGAGCVPSSDRRPSTRSSTHEE